MANEQMWGEGQEGERAVPSDLSVPLLPAATTFLSC